MSQVIVVVGNPVDGVSFHGPFVDAEEAGDWAEHEFRNDTWWIAPVKSV